VSGSTAQTLAEHWDGTSWSVVTTPSPPNGAELFSVAAAASNDVWAVGFGFGSGNPDFGETLIEHWDGSSWSVVSSPTSTVENTSLDGVVAISSNNVWAVGGNSGNALVEHWDGMSWSVVSSPAFTGEGNLSAVSADASNDIWAAAPGAPGFLHFDGMNWSRVTSPNMEAEGITALSPTNVWAVGTVGVFINHRSFRQAAIEHWDGTNWSIVASPNPNPTGPSTLIGIAAISANNIWAVGSIGVAKTITEHWDGTSWRIIHSPNPAANQNELFGVTALSDGTVAAVGHQEDVKTDQPLILMNHGADPKSAITPSALAAPVPTAAAQTPTIKAPLEPMPVDRLFAAAGGADQPLPTAGRRSGADGMAEDGDLDAL
jgi:hypothetical protein